MHAAVSHPQALPIVDPGAPGQDISLLIIAEHDADIQTLTSLLAEARNVKFTIETASSLESGLHKLRRHRFHVAILDLSLSDGAGLTNVDQARSVAPQTSIIVLSSLDDESVAIEAVHEGAQDYLVRDQLNSALLTRSIRYAIERQIAENALLEAESKFRGMVENLVEGVFQTSPDGHYLHVNHALARIYGYDNPEELMRGITDIGQRLYVDPARRDEFVRLMEQHDVVTDFESQIYRKDGSIIWIAENVRTVRDREGTLLYYEGTVEDITLRHQAAETVRNSEALYHSLVETLPQNIFRKDLEGKFTFANSRFCQTLKTPLAEIVGKSDFDFFPIELARKYHADDLHVIQSGLSYETIEEHRPPGGGVLHVQVVKTPLHDARGNIIGLQGIFWDITEKRLAEERERKMLQELAQSQELLSAKNRQMEEDIRMAREIQLAILPQQYPVFPHNAPPHESRLRFHHRYSPSGQVGGDFFNVLSLSDTTAAIIICDVMGHGVRSALITAMLRALIEDLAREAHDPGLLLTELNRGLRAILHQSGSPTFSTAFCLTADLDANLVRFASAGHPRQLLIHADHLNASQLTPPPQFKRPPLGLMDSTVYPVSQSAFHPGDRILLFTDGLFEVENPDHQIFSIDLLSKAALRHSQQPTLHELIDSILSDIAGFSGTKAFEDDVCLLGIEFAPA